MLDKIIEVFEKETKNKSVIVEKLVIRREAGTKNTELDILIERPKYNGSLIIRLEEGKDTAATCFAILPKDATRNRNATFTMKRGFKFMREVTEEELDINIESMIKTVFKDITKTDAK